MVTNNVAAIVGDASMYHVFCAGKVYGHPDISLVMTGGYVPDREGNALGTVMAGSEDLYRIEDDGTPYGCDCCGAYLVEDDTPAYSPLARDIRNLAVGWHSTDVTAMLASAAHIAEQFDNAPDTLTDKLAAWSYQCANDIIRADVLALASAWCEKWNSREVVHLHRVINDCGERVLGDNDGYEWGEYDMRGYLDNLGEYECSSCGCRLDSHAYYAQDDAEYYCPECVVIE